MKNIVRPLILFLLVISCGKKQNTSQQIINQSTLPKNIDTCYIKGVIDQYKLSKQSYVIIHDLFTEENDTIKIIDGKFDCKIVANDRTVKKITMTEGKNNLAMIIPVKGVVNVDLNDLQKVNGGKLNDSLSSLLVDILKLNVINGKVVFYVNNNDKLKSIYLDNIDNGLGRYAISLIANISPNRIKYKEFKELIAAGPDYIRKDSNILNILIKMEPSSEGKMFLDFDGQTLNGKKVKFSDYVGKGNYVLANFWGTKCPVCDHQIKYIKDVYNKYKGNDFIVIGIGNNSKDSTELIRHARNINTPWIQIITSNKTVPELYNFSGNPNFIIFAPDGIILKRSCMGDMNNENLMKTVDSIMLTKTESEKLL